MSESGGCTDDKVDLFRSFLGYGKHVALYSEEISRGGEGLGVCREVRLVLT